MISYYGIAASPIAADVIATYDLTATTSAPSLSSTINYYFNIAATTTAPSIELSVEFSVIHDIQATTIIPNLNMTLLSESLYNITASTKIPLISSEFYSDLYLNIGSSTNLPSLSIDMISGNIYNISTSTRVPYLYAELSFPTTTLATTAWCVNLTTGGHSRYTNYPDATATSIIESYVDTANIDFGIPTIKHIHDIYIKSRASEAEMAIGTTVDEHMVRTGYRVSLESSGGLHRRRCRLPKGMRGVSWKFRIGNVDNSSIEVTQAEILIAPTVRHQ